ncbi:toxin-activating lysine-acyltransferase [Massilia sp. TWP1-3-3]|uniref:toxin-activating lysine-acyltransferase n=1 Tax=Massilia sp. TWP1-3-3 TaxID=2804573 RepID=UPI003CF50321
MEYSTLTVDGRASTQELERAQFIGFVMALATRSQVHNSTAIWTQFERATTAHSLGMYHLFFNSYGQCVGYVLWAMISSEVESKLLTTGDASLHISEWTEGANLWIVDFVVPFGSLRHALEKLRDSIFAEQRVATYFRYKNGRQFAKRLSRERQNGFFNTKRKTARLAQ